jgi:IS6 family transposase
VSPPSVYTPARTSSKATDANNRIEADHGWLKARLRPMRGLKRDRTARVIIRGHALVQNIRRGNYELGCDSRTHRRVATAFIERVCCVGGGSRRAVRVVR